MSIAASSIADAAISAQPGGPGLKKKGSIVPGNRKLVAKSDIVTAPEPR